MLQMKLLYIKERLLKRVHVSTIYFEFASIFRYDQTCPRDYIFM